MPPLAIEWTWPETPIAILIAIAVAFFAHWALIRAINKFTAAAMARAVRHAAGKATKAEALLLSASGLAAERYSARAATTGSLLRSVTNVVMVTLALLTVLSILNVPLTPLLASAGVGGVALGFGAQSLVKDYLSGIFMIVEDQYGVGDLIDTGEVIGTVEEVGLRVTRIRDMGGQVWYVRNGEIIRVGNLSQGWSTATIKVPVASDENPERVIPILARVVDDVYAEEKWADVLLEKPSVAGVTDVSGGSMIISIFGKTAPNQHWAVQREILEQAMLALRTEGIRGPIVPPEGPVRPPGATAE